MKDETPRFLLYRGDILLGVVNHTHDDFPCHKGSFEPSQDFASVKALFDKEISILESDNCDLDEWEAAWTIITAPGLRLVPVGGGNTISEPLIHIDGTETWWR